MKYRFAQLLFSIIVAAATCFAQGETADLRLHEFESKVFNNSRSLRILLPSGYEDEANASRRYPVLYLNDGQNLFDEADSIFNNAEWKVDETVYRLVENGEIEPIIVVGIDNAGRSRRPNEYLPWEDKYLSPPMPDPQGAKYPEFLEDEVIPFIESRYRVSDERGSRGLGGSSYGALISLYTAIKRPHLFGRLLLESPSLYVHDAEVLNLANYLSFTGNPSRVYVGVGTNEEGKGGCTAESDGGEAVADVKRLEPKLDNRFFGTRKREVKIVVEVCATHHEDAWARRLPDALRFLYGRNLTAEDAGESQRRGS